MRDLWRPTVIWTDTLNEQGELSLRQQKSGEPSTAWRSTDQDSGGVKKVEKGATTPSGACDPRTHACATAMATSQQCWDLYMVIRCDGQPDEPTCRRYLLTRYDMTRYEHVVDQSRSHCAQWMPCRVDRVSGYSLIDPGTSAGTDLSRAQVQLNT